MPFELHSSQGISCGDTAYHGDQGRTTCNQDGVQHVIAHGSQRPDVHKVGPQGLNRQDGAVDGEDLCTALQGGAEHHEVGIQNQQTDIKDNEVQEHPLNNLADGHRLLQAQISIVTHAYSSPFFSVETM